MSETLAIIKPDAFDKSEEIIEIISKSGLNVIQRKEMELTVDQACEFYAEHLGKAFYEELINYMTQGPVVILVLGGMDNAVNAWRNLIGPTKVSEAVDTQPESIRALFGTEDGKNAVHGSDSQESAKREIEFFFPESSSQRLHPNQSAKEYLAEKVNQTLLKGLTELSKSKPSDPIVWVSDWLLVNN